MGTVDISLKRIFHQLYSANLGMALQETETYLTAWPNPQSTEKLNVLKREYQLMSDYWQQGTKDPQLAEQYHRLLQRLYVLCANISIHKHMSSLSFLQGLYNGVRQSGYSWSIDNIRAEMENFVSETAMLQLEPEHKQKEKRRELYKHHQQQMNALFNYVLTGHVWTDGVGSEMEKILLSPTVDINDQQLLISAIMLSLMNRFDMVKFRLLVNVYRQSPDEPVRQRALVGWVMSIDDEWLDLYPEIKELIDEVLKSKRACRELTELQLQLIYTLNADKDSAVVHDEIVPDLLKNNSMRVTNNGIEEVKEDPLEDVLHPDAAEERMERLEASFKKMLDMQKQGSDIYFGGFSQMKRYPFFYDISNWFVPFYMQHPDISQFVERMDGNSFLESMLQKGPFCDSDKYSFLIAFQQVYTALPENLRQMMKRGETPMGEMSVEDQQSAALIRRCYLMDMYRFFKLFPNRTAFCNPFDTSEEEWGMCLFFLSVLFNDTPLEQRKRDIVVLLRKMKMKKAVQEMLCTFPSEMHDVQYWLWMGNPGMAVLLDPNNERALAEHARKSFHRGEYSSAEEAYDNLLLINPDKRSYLLNKAICQVNLMEIEDALKTLYQLNYEQPDDQEVQRVLAWALTCDGKLEQAERMFQQLEADEALTGSDNKNYGYCLWLLGHINKAIGEFVKSYQQGGESPDDFDPYFFDTSWLKERGISDIEIKMMIDQIGMNC
jgi:hypothetical protein